MYNYAIYIKDNSKKELDILREYCKIVYESTINNGLVIEILKEDVEKIKNNKNISSYRKQKEVINDNIKTN